MRIVDLRSDTITMPTLKIQLLNAEFSIENVLSAMLSLKLPF